MNYWLMKSEPDTFSVDDLIKRKQQIEPWDGVRNYQARNMLKNEMQEGDLAFFYHSSCTPPGIVGIVKIVRAGYPDATAFDPKSPYFDPQSTPDKPRWYRVDVQFLEKFPRMITLAELRKIPKLAKLHLLRPHNRLSIMPVDAPSWQTIIALLTSKK